MFSYVQSCLRESWALMKKIQWIYREAFIDRSTNRLISLEAFQKYRSRMAKNAKWAIVLVKYGFQGNPAAQGRGVLWSGPRGRNVLLVFPVGCTLIWVQDAALNDYRVTNEIQALKHTLGALDRGLNRLIPRYSINFTALVCNVSLICWPLR